MDIPQDNQIMEKLNNNQTFGRNNNDINNKKYLEFVRSKIQNQLNKNSKPEINIQYINITPNNINHLVSLLVKDLSETTKITNRKALISNKKKEIFQRLLNLTFEEYQLFWYKLTDGKLKKGNAQHIKSNNISKAKEILKSLEEKKNENEINKNDEEEKDLINLNSKKNKTIKELIQAAEFRDKEIEKINEEILGTDNDISSDESELIDNDSSNIDDKNMDIKNEEKEEKERKEMERKEKENKEKILKQIMEEKDEIDIFN
jgi:hypothetical protein